MASAALIIGIQAVQFGLLAKLYGSRMGLFSTQTEPRRLFGIFSLAKVAAVAAVIISAGIVGVVISVLEWKRASFGALDTRHEVRLMIPSITALVVGFQLLLGRLFMGLLGAEFAENPTP